MREPGWIDRDDREPASFTGLVVLQDGSRVPVTIVNISEGGCQLKCNETLPVAATVELHLDGQQIEAEVRWALPGLAGLRIKRGSNGL